MVRPDQVRLTCGAEPFLEPAAITGHDVIDLVIRQLRDREPR